MTYPTFSKPIWLIILALTVGSCGGNHRTPIEPLPPASKPALISRVIAYVPAPGQHVNKMPKWEPGDTQESINAKALASLRSGSTLSLGGFGGHITIALAYPIFNHPGRDMRIMGNAFVWQAQYNPNKNPPGLATSSEPGIVQVAQDKNRNGLPDDEWYELHGSAHTAPGIRHDYAITYYRPSSSHSPTAGVIDDVSYPDIKYIRWTDNHGGEGFLPRNQYHNQSYFPEWITRDSYTLSGTCLPTHVVRETDETGKHFWTAYALVWGYVDDVPNEHEGSTFDIDWAVGSDGKPANLQQIDFVRIYTGMHALAGAMGEVSTDFAGIEEIKRD